MSRYTINIGDDFPMGEDGQGRPGGRPRGFRAGTVLRVLFCIAVVAIVVGHPFKVAVAVGILLLLRRSAWWQQMRADLRARGVFRAETWREAWQDGKRRWAEGCARHGGQTGWCHGPRGGRRPDRGFREFV